MAIKFSNFIKSFMLCMAVCVSASAQDKDGIKVLTLHQAINGVLHRNFSIKENALEWKRSDHVVKVARGEYEPDFIATYKHNYLERENTSKQIWNYGGRQEIFETADEYYTGVEGKAFMGGMYRLGVSLEKLRGSYVYENEYTSFAGLSIELPLLKGAWAGTTAIDIKLAEHDWEIAFHNFRKEVMVSLLRTEMGYWELVFSQEQLKIARDSVEIAQKLVDDSKERVKNGKMSQVDLLEAEAGLADRQLYMADAQNNLQNAMKQLKLLLSDDSFNDEDIVASESILAIDNDSKEDIEDIEPVIDDALLAQPDYIIARETLRKERTLVRYYRDQRLPELMLTGSYGANGFAYTAERALAKLDGQQRPSWSVGLEMRVPLGLGIKEIHELRAAIAKKDKAECLMMATEHEIENTIMTLVVNIEKFKERLDHIRTVVEFKRKLLDVELEKMNAGKSNTRLIYEKEEDFYKVKERQLEIAVEYRTALLQLAFLRGKTLSIWGLNDLDSGNFSINDLSGLSLISGQGY